MAVKRVKSHARKTTKGKTRVRAHVAHVRSIPMPSYKPDKPKLRVEGPDAAALLKHGLNVGSPVTLTVKGYVEEATAEQNKPKYGPQHSLRICADEISAPKARKTKKDGY